TRVGPRLRGDRESIEAAAELLVKAERPVIMAGDAVAQSKAHAELIELAELLGAPVYPEFVPSRATFPWSHPLYRGAMTRLDAARKALAAERAARVGKARALTNPSPREPLAVLHAIGETLPADAVVVEEALSSGPGLRDLIKSNDPQSFYGLRGGGIGWGLPA